jgi:hypothetical protein
MHVISANHLRRGRRHARLAGGVAAITLALTTCAAPADGTGPGVPARHGCVCRGEVVSVVPVASFSAPALAAALKSIGLGSWSVLVSAYRVTCRCAYDVTRCRVSGQEGSFWP